MKKIIILVLSSMVFICACDPEWALHPKNQGWAYIVNESESDIIFRGYGLLTGGLNTQKTIHPGDTVCVSSASWDERSSNWNEIQTAGWDPFIATLAQRYYMVNRDEFNEKHHLISILTSPNDSVSWILNVNLIEEDSIFNEANWELEEFESEGYYNNFAWYYTFN